MQMLYAYYKGHEKALTWKPMLSMERPKIEPAPGVYFSTILDVSEQVKSEIGRAHV